MNTSYQPLRKTRSALEIFRASLQYLTDHGRSLLGPVSAGAIPVILLAVFLAFFATGRASALDHILSYKNSLDKNLFLLLVGAYIVYVLGLCLFNVSVNKHLFLSDTREEKGLSFQDITKDLAEDVKGFIISFLIIYAVYFVVTEAVSYGTTYLNAGFRSYSDEPSGALGSLIESLIVLLPVLVISAMVLFIAFSALFVCYRDHLGGLEAIKRVIEIFREKPGKAIKASSFLLLLAWVLYGFIYVLANSVQTLSYSSTGLFSPNFFFVIDLLRILCTCFIAVYVQVAMVLLFTSLEDEVEGHYIRSKIDTI